MTATGVAWTRPPRPGRTEVLGLAALLAAVTAFLLWWWDRERRGLPWFIDEAGYLVFAIGHGAAVADGSWSALWDGIDAQAPAAPLVTVASGLGLAVTDRPAAVAAATMVVSVVGLVAATWFLARAYLPGPWALLAAGVVAALPTVLSLGGTYYFAPAAAAWFVTALAFLDRGRWGESVGWSAAAGAASAAAALSRTMLIGFFPAVAAVAIAVVVWRARWHGEPGRRRAAGLAVAAGVAVVVLAPWFFGNFDPIVDYLGGDQSPRGGGTRSIGAGGAWRLPGIRDLRVLLGDLLVPMALALALGAAVAAGFWLTRRRGARPTSAPAHAPATVGAPIGPLAAVVGLGGLTLVLTSQAVGQWLPLLPPAVVVVVAGLHRWAPLPLARVAAGVLVALSLFQVASASRLDDGLSRLRTVDAGPLGRVPITDTRTLLEDELTAVLDGGALDERFLAVPGLLDDLVSESLDRARAVDEPAVVLVAGGHDPLVNLNTLPLADHLAGGGGEVVVGALPLDPDLDASGWAAALTDPRRGQPNSVVTVEPSSDRRGSRRAYDTLVASLPAAGFRVVGDATLPDGRPVTLWFRPRADAGT